MKQMSMLGWVAFVLVVVGAINWGLVGIAGFNLVDTLFGGMGTMVTGIIYDLVGLAGLYMIFAAVSDSKM